jgi:Na+-transporting NADH:ubiquinone oxidoreductase subunit NqrB
VSNFSTEVNDPRYFQILYLGSFLFFGIAWLGWSTESFHYLTTVLVCITVQMAFCYLFKKPLSSIKSALITALGLCLLLKSPSVLVSSIAAFTAIASKFLITYNNKHIFNPANIGIVLAIVLSGQAWVSPGQWGSSTLLWFLIGSAGLMMVLKVGRVDTTLVFLSTLAFLTYARDVWYLGWEVEVWLHKLSNGTLLLFAFFMITDPRTTPNHKRARTLWAVFLAILLFVASAFFYVQTAAIWLLFVISPLTIVLDKRFKHRLYQWNVIN